MKLTGIDVPTGWMTTSARESWAAAIFEYIALTDWKIVSSVVSGVTPATPPVMSTAITTSAPRRRAASTATGLTTPPSTYVRSPIRTGRKTPGMAQLARA